LLGPISTLVCLVTARPEMLSDPDFPRSHVRPSWRLGYAPHHFMALLKSKVAPSSLDVHPSSPTGTTRLPRPNHAFSATIGLGIMSVRGTTVKRAVEEIKKEHMQG
jgi:hypothetical protein